MSSYVIVTIKLRLEVWNDEHIILCKFDGRSISDLKL